ncbi:T cell receptor beta chain MC.7.G5-like [Syngnathus acus]|uniref:T cell receptor beta chain MC.7.G5-like n=1 Tax=Syngnathus acus TaxID=161584 RepID=UPI001885AD04|nr:T cell receptor beta chain MC.7.G5-like [Syngnathus acus]
MFLLVLSLAASVTLLSGQDVTQKPADIVEAVGHSVTIECTHRIPDYDRMLWYRQRGRGMQLIGYMYYEIVTMEPGQDDVQLTGSAKSGATCKMVIPALHWNSSAVYYCAARSHGAVSSTPLSGQNVMQKPADIVEAANHSVTIECSHTITHYNQILWYHQRDAGMQLIGYMYYKIPTMEHDWKDVKLEGNAESGQTCKMVIPKLRPDSSGIYYCAAKGVDDGDVTLSFTHTFANCDTIQWYQRRVSGSTRSMELVALVNYQKASVEPAFKDCVDPAYFGAGTRLTVQEPNVKIVTPKVTLIRPSAHECTNEKDKETKKKTLVCIATDFYPDHVDVVWMVDGEERVSGVAKDPEAQRRGASYSITSRLRVKEDEWHSNREFKCVVTFFNGKNYNNYTDFINGENAEKDKVPRESFLRLAQSARLSYGVLIAKSCVYAAFVAFLLWRLRIVELSREKEQDRKDKNKSY